MEAKRPLNESTGKPYRTRGNRRMTSILLRSIHAQHGNVETVSIITQIKINLTGVSWKRRNQLLIAGIQDVQQTVCQESGRDGTKTSNSLTSW